MSHTSRNSEAIWASSRVQAAKGGDRRAFGELVVRYRPRVFALALHLSGRSSEADDITQDVFVRAFRQIGAFEGRSEFFTWLYRITVNLALNRKRAEHRHRGLGLDDDRVRMAVAVDAEGDPRAELELRESYSLLVEALDGLAAPLRATVVLVALQGLSHAEAAVVLNVSEGTVAWRMHDARQRLRIAFDSMARRGPALPWHKQIRPFDELHHILRRLKLEISPSR